MAKLINIDKTNFIDANIERYASDKISQYSRYLDQSHIFCTYYPINKIMSRVDNGLGNTYSVTGSNSSIRYNKIKNLPLFNVPELKPELEYDETGTEINLELSGITLLPNTVKPNAGDYLLIKLPGTKEFLFIVKSFEYNTIQSNDYYQISLKIKDIGTDLEKKNLDGLIVDTYETIYENIGTEDNCFIRSEDISKIEAIVSLISEIKDMYMNNFWDNRLGCFSIKCYDGINYFYDYLLSMFIMKSELFYEYGNPNTIMMVNMDCSSSSEKLFNRTIFYALLNGTTDYLSPDIYYYTRSIFSPTSIFNIYDYPCHTVELVILKYVAKNGNYIEYFSHEMIKSILDPINRPFDKIYKKEPIEPIGIEKLPYPKILEPIEREVPEVEHLFPSENEGLDSDSESNLENTNDISSLNSSSNLMEISRVSEDNNDSSDDEYVEPKSIYISYTPNSNNDVEACVVDSEPEPKPVTIYNTTNDNLDKEIPWDYKEVDYLELILYNYLINNDQEIERKALVPYLLNSDLHSYYYLPIIIFILKKKYDKYFNKTEY